MGPQKTGESSLASFSCPALSPKDSLAKGFLSHTHSSLIQSLETVILNPGGASESSVDFSFLFFKDPQVIMMQLRQRTTILTLPWGSLSFLLSL